MSQKFVNLKLFHPEWGNFDQNDKDFWIPWKYYFSDIEILRLRLSSCTCPGSFIEQKSIYKTQIPVVVGSSIRTCEPNEQLTLIGNGFNISLFKTRHKKEKVTESRERKASFRSATSGQKKYPEKTLYINFGMEIFKLQFIFIGDSRSKILRKSKNVHPQNRIIS